LKSLLEGICLSCRPFLFAAAFTLAQSLVAAAVSTAIVGIPILGGWPGDSFFVLGILLGLDLVFWGGGVDTQKTMAFGTPEEVYTEVCERIRIFNQDGGFVFDAIHNIQGNTPIENVEAMFRAIRDGGAR